MPDLKITQFSQIVTLDDTDVLAIVDLTDNTTKKVTVAQLKLLAPVQSVNGSTGAVTVQAVLVSGTNIKTINSTSLLGSGNIAVQAVLVSGTNIKTINSTSLLGSGNIAVQAVLVSGTNIKTINGNSILGSGDLTVTTSAAGADTNVQYNSGGSFAGSSEFNFDGTNVAIGKAVGGIGSKKLEMLSNAQCVALFESDTTGGGIAFMDTTTLDADQVGVGAFGDILCLRGGGNAVGTVQIGNAFVNVRGNTLRNFIPEIQTEAVGLTIDSTNEDTYCAGVLEVTGAITVTIDNSVRNGFSISVIQMDANNCTFAASGGSLTLQNRQGHTQTNGQWATVTLFKNGNNLILAGDTI